MHWTVFSQPLNPSCLPVGRLRLSKGWSGGQSLGDLSEIWCFAAKNYAYRWFLGTVKVLIHMGDHSTEDRIKISGILRRKFLGMSPWKHTGFTLGESTKVETQFESEPEISIGIIIFKCSGMQNPSGQGFRTWAQRHLALGRPLSVESICENKKRVVIAATRKKASFPNPNRSGEWLGN